MQIRVHADDQVSCDEELIRRVEGVVEGMLERFSARISRIDVHLSDLDSPRPGDRDKSCKLEARMAGLSPVIASHESVTLTEAIHAAADKLQRALAAQIRQQEYEQSVRRTEERLFGSTDQVRDSIR
jgi:predicted nuclease with TOPRIM domain